MTIPADAVDAHQHYWRYDPALDAWIDAAGPLARDFAPGDARPEMDRVGIGRAVAVQARSSEAETASLLAAATRDPWIAGVVGWLDLTAADLEARIGHWRARGPLVGLRHIAQAEPDDFLLRDPVVHGVRTTLAAGLAYDILIHPRQLGAAARFVERVGEGALVLDHGAKPPIAAGGWQPWADDLAAIAAFPQLVCKLSGMVTEAVHRAWRPADVHRYLDHLLACFGPQRLMFGSDWPVCTLAADYAGVHRLARDWVATRCPDAAASIFGDTARRVYRLDGSRFG